MQELLDMTPLRNNCTGCDINCALKDRMNNFFLNRFKQADFYNPNMVGV